MENIDSASLMVLHGKLLHEYEQILFQEETFWFQKSREKWIKLGSRNTSFFHAQTIIRRKRNKVHGLNLSSGIWCNDDNILKDEVVKYFKELLSRDGEVRVGSDGDCRTRLSDDARRVLTKPVSKIEVYEALMSIKSYKAPGPDGFQPIFFKIF